MEGLHATLFAAATRLLVGRLHSRGELRTKLLRLALRAHARHATPPTSSSLSAPSPSPPPASASATTDAVLAELASRGLLDDAAYAEWHVAQRVTGPRPRSRAQLASELIAKRVSGDVAAAAIGAFSDVDAALAAAARKPRLSDAALRKHLAWKAFSYQAIDAALQARREEGSTPRHLE